MYGFFVSFDDDNKLYPCDKVSVTHKRVV